MSLMLGKCQQDRKNILGFAVCHCQCCFGLVVSREQAAHKLDGLCMCVCACVCQCAPTSDYSSFCHHWCCGWRLHRPSPLLLRKDDVGGIMTICFLHPTELDDINVATVVLSFCSLAAIAVLQEAGLAEQHHDAFRRTSTELPLTWWL